MHIVKYNQIRNNLRKEHINSIIQQLRHSLLTHNNPLHQEHPQPNSAHSDPLTSDSSSPVQNQPSYEQEAKIMMIIENFKELMENRQKLEKQECADTSQFCTLLADYRRLIFRGKGKVNILFVRDIYKYLKFRITQSLASFENLNGDLHTQTQWQNLQQNHFQLYLTLMILLSEYLNQGGPLTLTQLTSSELNSTKSERDEYYYFSSWLIGEYQSWRVQCEQELSKTIEMIEEYYEEKIQNWKIGMQLMCIKYYLIELFNLIRIILHYKPMTLNNEIKALMSYNMVRLLLKLMRSYLSTDELKYIILETFGEVAVQKNSASFIHTLIQNDFLQFIRLQFFIHQEYKNINPKTKKSQKETYSLNIITSIIYIISCISIKQSDRLWAQGICHEMKAAINEISLPQLKQDFTQVVLQCIITANQPYKIYQWSDLMDWVIKIIESRIQEQNFSDQKQDKLIEQCLEVLKYFFQIGKYQMETMKLNANPYRIKFQYLNGSFILSKSQQCQRLLEQELADQREVSL